ncbi:MAG: ATP-binding cassette domain-containing protein [Acidobacteriota bacterium]|nr:MAG: ATP-binding cassette domain-containing protein [Acidobacteriota bacterium]
MIEAQNLTMRYGSVTAVEDASFTVRPREVVGLLGPNGAGKSTIMKILTTYLWPTSGTAKICGKDVLDEPTEVRKRIGYLPESLPLYMDMEVGRYLRFVGHARGLDGGTLRARMDWTVERCGIQEVYRRPIRELSKGFRQRTALAQALVHDPEVVILDEPTSGLDPHQIIEIRKLVRELAREKTVIFSTHILHEVEVVADRIVIISRGHIIADGTIDELRQKAAKTQRLEIAVEAAREDVEQAFSGLLAARRVTFLEQRNGTVWFHLETEPSQDTLHQIREFMHEQGWKIQQLRDVPLTLEETFLALTEAEDSTA